MLFIVFLTKRVWFEATSGEGRSKNANYLYTTPSEIFSAARRIRSSRATNFRGDLESKLMYHLTYNMYNDLERSLRCSPSRRAISRLRFRQKIIRVQLNRTVRVRLLFLQQFFLEIMHRFRAIFLPAEFASLEVRLYGVPQFLGESVAFGSDEDVDSKGGNAN